MAITLTVISIQPVGSSMLITATRSDNSQTQVITVNVSSAPSVMAALALATTAIQAASAALNAAAANASGLSPLIGQTF
jgi:hypothetical protein